MVKNERIPSAYKMTSFDISFLCTMVSLDYTTDLTLKRIHENKEIQTQISMKEVKNLLLLYVTFVIAICIISLLK